MITIKKIEYSLNLINVMDAIKPTKKEVVPAPKKMSKKTKSVLAGLGVLGVLTSVIVPPVVLNDKIEKSKTTKGQLTQEQKDHSTTKGQLTQEQKRPFNNKNKIKWNWKWFKRI